MSATLLRSATTLHAGSTTTRSRRAGGVLGGVAVVFLAWDTAIKLLAVAQAVDGTVALGWRPHHVPLIGLIELLCLALLVVPRTAPLGAVLFTGYLGGAIATHLRLDNPLLSHTLFPIYIAALIWGGLWLRDARVRRLLDSAR